MNVIINAIKLVLVIFEDDDAGYVYGYFPNVTKTHKHCHYKGNIRINTIQYHFYNK